MTVNPTRLWRDIVRLWSDRDHPEEYRALARAYWRAVLGGSAVLICASLFWGAWMLFSVVDMYSPAPMITGGGGAGLNRVQLQATLEAFGARRTEYDEIKSSGSSLADPSK
jgi:hypothetical protein